MRVIYSFAALSGAVAVICLAMALHLFANDPDVSFVYLAAALQLSSALAGLVIAGRSGALNVTAAALMLIGASMFAGEIWLSAFHIHAFEMMAPLGGGLTIIGWIVLAFAKPN